MTDDALDGFCAACAEADAAYENYHAARAAAERALADARADAAHRYVVAMIDVNAAYAVAIAADARAAALDAIAAKE